MIFYIQVHCDIDIIKPAKTKNKVLNEKYSSLLQEIKNDLLSALKFHPL